MIYNHKCNSVSVYYLKKKCCTGAGCCNDVDLNKKKSA